MVAARVGRSELKKKPKKMRHGFDKRKKAVHNLVSLLLTTQRDERSAMMSEASKMGEVVKSLVLG